MWWNMMEYHPSNLVHGFSIHRSRILTTTQQHLWSQPPPLLPIIIHRVVHQFQRNHQLFSSFTADGSEYSAGDSDFDTDDDYEDTTAASLLRKNNDNEMEDDDDDDENRLVPTIELQPPPLSKNAGNRFVAVIWDRVIKNRNQFNNHYPEKRMDMDDDDWYKWNDHYDRIRYTEEHVMFCRKQNLYNTTFNQHSMVDILWSLPMFVLYCFLFHSSFFFKNIHTVDDV
jgi:hypothetical protein